ncbi:DegT/DnrJ/EryC1/StrS family aminotransferase [Intestinimonas butyriciproducens]|uniref:UDP-4-amino-4-deoxy-L-arabinose--oxoglutarate aminotransferase n=1 Tax=Intestinimonas butyriciproducens TaxID=1297617 RepID=A0A0S2W5B6_9FIRM|nr:DegT/DnrJ/EryC1/StrS family aminotransferase [Intestinimonas butyriciproducens]ALP94466.1 UDP-4-amino-4-deoxy-L-arabinose--oxoglutarate aminotransferase [Intestinimonas butyriciproducens]MDB7860650.1 DegT/DnrJ/EryC1/StrS family aminotransferase [Intestinimonas butyriciproducens]MDB7862812.1 DegT/DnrJ/EryC1/StrS family aminotransferase [Intestinimonas butyriciproducens]
MSRSRGCGEKINAKTRAVVFVGYGGRMGRLDEIITLCKKHGLKLILDAAHMSGTKVNGICPGTWEGVDVAVYSYQAVKSLATADSGMICFADEKYDAFAGNPNIQIISAPHADECSYHTYEIAVPDRDALLDELAKHEIYGGVHYRDNTEYAMYAYDHGTCPHAHEISRHIITLPLNLWLTDGDVDQIIKIVNCFPQDK